MVFPVPDSPKKRATSPSLPTFAEQCIDSTLFLAEEIERSEDRFLNLTGVTGSGDEDHLSGEVKGDQRARIGAVLPGIGMKIRTVENGVFEAGGGRSAQQAGE